MFYSKSTYFTRALSMNIYVYEYKLTFHGTTNNYLAKKSRDDSECEILVRVHFIDLHWWKAFFHSRPKKIKFVAQHSFYYHHLFLPQHCSVPYSSSLLIVLYC